VVEDLRAAEPAREVEAHVEPGLVAQGDARLLRLAVENLLRNSWKFSRGRKPAHIRFGASGVNGETVFFVDDDGAGFDMEYAQRLFRPFQRLHSDAEFEGTGIGLATVQRVIHRHGGRIWAESAVGRGATFRFTLRAHP
jgi:signal transduction histidine kinase